MIRQLIFLFFIVSISFSCCNNLSDCEHKYKKALFYKNYFLVNCTGIKLLKYYNCSELDSFNHYFYVCKDIKGAIGFALTNLNSNESEKYLSDAGYIRSKINNKTKKEVSLIDTYQQNEINYKYESSNKVIMMILSLLFILILSLYLLIEVRSK